MTEDRRAEVSRLLATASQWAARRADVRALALIGSWGRGTARMRSDVDLVLLTDDPRAYVSEDEWMRQLGAGRVVRTMSRGVVTERRFALPSGLEVDVGVGTADWAGVAPVDPGTREVVANGLYALHDPDGLLAALRCAVVPLGRGSG